MISLEQLFERLSSVTENNISLASTSGSSYGYGYGYYGGGSTDTTIRVFQGTICLLKDQCGSYITTTVLDGKLRAQYDNTTKIIYLPMPTSSNRRYVFIPSAWGLAYANSSSTYTWGTLTSDIVNLYNTQSSTTIYGPSGDGGIYCIMSGSNPVGYCKAQNSSLITDNSYLTGATTITVNVTYTYSFIVKTIKPKATYFRPLLYQDGDTSESIESIVTRGNADYANHNSGKFSLGTASTNAQFYGLTVCGTPTEAQVKYTAENNGAVSSITTYSITSSTPNVLYCWHPNDSSMPNSKPCRGIDPVFQQVPAAFSGITTYKPLLNETTETACKYFPLGTANFLSTKSKTFFIYNYDIFYIRVFVVSGSTLITDVPGNYKVKYGSEYFEISKTDFGDATLYHNSSITKTPTYTIKSDISGDTYSKYSSSTTSFYFGVIRPNTSATMDLTLTLCKADDTEVSTLTGTITRTTNTYFMNYFVFNIGSPKLYIGSDQVKSLYIGSTPVKEVWVGSTQVYP